MIRAETPPSSKLPSTAAIIGAAAACPVSWR
jgi:hypothetical protein